MRRIAFPVLVTLAVAFLAVPAAAQEKYPSRPIDFVVTWGAGGGADAMARQLGSLSQSLLGVALPASNVPGAAGNTGLAQVLSGKPDGYTLATYIQDTLMTLPMGLARYKVDDLEWITRTQVADSFLFVRADGPFKTIQELFKHAEANPGKLRVGATGFGTVDDVTVKFLGKRGYQMITVPYPKPGERYAAALGGHTEVLYEQAGDVLQYLKAGQLRPLIIFAERRHPAFPDITLPQFRGVVARKGTAPDRIKILADAFHKAMETPEWKKFAEEWYFRPDSYQGTADFTKWVSGEVTTLERLVKEFRLRQ
jgi:tripartite-type tricarboxylate transporter receptor subunit TctC